MLFGIKKKDALFKECENCREEYFCRKDKKDISRFCSKQCWGRYTQIEQLRLRDEERAKETPEKTRTIILESFERWFEKTDGCWLWNGSKKSKLPYGQFTFRGKQHIASRKSYQLYIGEVPKGLIVRHTCDNPSCVNPSHLRAGTYLDNQLDKLERRRTKVEKLSKEQVIEIKKLLINCKKRINGPCFIAKQFGVSPQTIHSIKKGKTWGWLTIDDE